MDQLTPYDKINKIALSLINSAITTNNPEIEKFNNKFLQSQHDNAYEIRVYDKKMPTKVLRTVERGEDVYKYLQYLYVIEQTSEDAGTIERCNQLKSRITSETDTGETDDTDSAAEDRAKYPFVLGKYNRSRNYGTPKKYKNNSLKKLFFASAEQIVENNEKKDATIAEDSQIETIFEVVHEIIQGIGKDTELQERNIPRCLKSMRKIWKFISVPYFRNILRSIIEFNKYVTRNVDDISRFDELEAKVEEPQNLQIYHHMKYHSMAHCLWDLNSLVPNIGLNRVDEAMMTLSDELNKILISVIYSEDHTMMAIFALGEKGQLYTISKVPLPSVERIENCLAAKTDQAILKIVYMYNLLRSPAQAMFNPTYETEENWIKTNIGDYEDGIRYENHLERFVKTYVEKFKYPYMQCDRLILHVVKHPSVELYINFDRNEAKMAVENYLTDAGTWIKKSDDDYFALDKRGIVQVYREGTDKGKRNRTVVSYEPDDNVNVRVTLVTSFEMNQN